MPNGVVLPGFRVSRVDGFRGSYLLHAVPEDDVTEHQVGRTECVCGPQVWEVASSDGDEGTGLLAYHWSLDGRSRRRFNDNPTHVVDGDAQ